MCTHCHGSNNTSRNTYEECGTDRKTINCIMHNIANNYHPSLLGILVRTVVFMVMMEPARAALE
ncbi:hypothetical protein D3C73_1244130 [compost metagenome]